MARKKTPTLTDAEFKLMDVIWRKGQATVTEVLEGLPETDIPAYNTVLTILRILEDKDYLRHTKNGRAHVYHPLISRNEAQTTAVRHMVSRFFDNSPEMLMVNLLKDEHLSPEELARLREMIELSEERDRNDTGSSAVDS